VDLPGGTFFSLGGFLGRYVVRADTRDQAVQVATNTVGPGHFDTLRVRVFQGRDFTLRDDQKSPSVGIINQALAGQLWPNENPLGRSLRGEDGAFKLLAL
jgi:hypothetical protein